MEIAMTRILAAIALALASLAALAQEDPVLLQIEQERRAAQAQLQRNYGPHDRLSDLRRGSARSISRRGEEQARIAELQKAERDQQMKERALQLREREVRAMEQIANQPPPGSALLTCEQSWSNPRQMTCR